MSDPATVPDVAAVLATRKRKPGERWLPHEVETGLRALVMCGGSPRKAATMCNVPHPTLQKWATGVEHRERIEQLRVEMGPQLERVAIEGFRAFVIRAEEVKAAALEEVMRAIEEGELTGKAAAQALYSVSVAQGIAVQRGLELDGRPNGVAPERSLAELVGKLAKLGAVIDGSAVELPAGESDETST